VAVVINEFEVVPAPAEQPASAAPSGGQAAAGPTAHDIERIVERAVERGRRVRAH
jgi:hypothetical protein